MSSDQKKERAAAWFKQLRDDICAAFEAIERELSGPNLEAVADIPPGKFQKKDWDRRNEDGSPGGGGTMGLMYGRVFEKVGVNISTVHGQFSSEFSKQIPGAEQDPSFWASGISLVAHMRNPKVPAVHMNTRFIVTSRSWFGGGSDLNPIFPEEAETQEFHAAFKAACDRHNPAYYEAYKAWCDEYFFIKHRGFARGVGGIFYDYLGAGLPEKNPHGGDWEADFAFTQEVGRAFLEVYPALVRKKMEQPWSDEDREAQLVRRGYYAEFNLVWDRGTKFGLMTGGNTEAILMSLPPVAKWP